MFPSPFQLISEYHVLLLTGPLCLFLAALCFRAIIRARRKTKPAEHGISFVTFLLRSVGSPRRPRPPGAKDTKATAVCLIAGFGLLIIGLGHTIGVYASVVNAVRFRIEPARIEAVEVYRVPWEGRASPDTPVVITDRAALKDGFGRLPRAVPWSPNHETLRNGYRMRIKVAGEPSFSDRYLSVYRQSTKCDGVAVVVPHMGLSHWGTVNHAGRYTCPEFLDWVAKNVDPLLRPSNANDANAT